MALDKKKEAATLHAVTLRKERLEIAKMVFASFATAGPDANANDRAVASLRWADALLAAAAAE